MMHQPSNNNSNNKQPEQASFLVLIRATVQAKPNDIFATWYDDKGHPVNEYSFQQLWDAAGHCAWMLRHKLKLDKGDRVVLCYGLGLHFFAIFLGCLRAGVIAVIVYPPSPPLTKSLTKMSKVAEDCSPSLILTETKINVLRLADLANPTSKSRSLWPKDVKYQTTDWLDRSTTCSANKTSDTSLPFRGWIRSLLYKKKSNQWQQLPSFDDGTIQGSDVAFLQYTSGSTGNPKGVVITHSALRANVRLLSDMWAAGCTEDIREHPQTTFSWLPQYHDMGLIEMTIAPLSLGWRSHMMSPLSFIRNPVLWIDLVSKYRCDLTCAPDFAYQLVVRKFNEQQSKLESGATHTLDLSRAHFQNSAEPVRPDTRSKFTEIFSPHGLREDWFIAGYGLAEHVVAVTSHHGYQLSTLRQEDLQQYIAIAKTSSMHEYVNLKIVDPVTSQEVSGDDTGEIWISGPSVAAGYYKQSELSKEIFQAKLEMPDQEEITSATSSQPQYFLRTGDFGFFQDGYLYICGRMKDLIIVNGVNYYPQDVEHAVQDASPAVRPGCVAAFSSNETGDDGRLEIVFEIRSNQLANAAQVCQQVKTQVIQEIGLVPSRIVAVKERTIAKTTSGKIQRRRNRDLLHAEQHKIIMELASSILGYDDSDSNGVDLEKGGSQQQDHQAKDDSRSFADIVSSIIGHGLSPDDTWEDVGLSSMAELELRNQLSKKYRVSLSEDCFRAYPTCAALQAFVEKSEGQPLPVKLPVLESLDDGTLHPFMHGMILCLGVTAILFLFALSIIPAFELGRLLYNLDSANTIFLVNGNGYVWTFYPIIVPTWMLSFTSTVIIMKWAVVGRYKEGSTHATSMCYIRWWFVDRLMHLWELFVGGYIVGTPLMNIFCYLMGADVHRSSSLDSFIREFDLVKIGKHAEITQPIRCRMFGRWIDDRGASLRFRRIEVGDGCSIKGMLCPGAFVDDHSKVERLAVVVEGGQMPAGVLAKGNPAFIDHTAISLVESNRGTLASNIKDTNTIGIGTGDVDDGGIVVGDTTSGKNDNNNGWWRLGTLRLCWLVFELYFLFGMFLAVQILVQYRLPIWRYSRLLYWIVLIGLSSIGLLVSSVILKWLLIGRKKAGPYTPSLYKDFADWAADFHFRVAMLHMFMLTGNSRLWNLFLMAHGMDIDLESKVYPDDFQPSKVDLIRVKKSFISTFTVDVSDSDARCHKKITIESSSIGFSSHIGPGVTIRNSLITPQSHATRDVVREDPDPRNQQLSACLHISHELQMTVLYIVSLCVAGSSFIPAYEVWMKVLKPRSSLEAVPVLVICIIIQTIVWALMLKLSDLMAVGFQQHRTAERDASTAETTDASKIRPWNHAVYLVYHSLFWVISVWSFLPLLWGTPFMTWVLRFMGSTVEGQLLYFGYRVYEFQYISFGDKSVVDESMVAGHHGVFNTATLGPARVQSGMVLHRRCYAMANSQCKSPSMELGPQQVIFGSNNQHSKTAVPTLTLAAQLAADSSYLHCQSSTSK